MASEKPLFTEWFDGPWTASVESEFNLGREDLLYLLKPIINKAMVGIEVHDCITIKVEIKEGRVRAIPEDRRNQCPEFFDVEIPKQLEGTLRDWAAGPERAVPQPPPPVLSESDQATWAGIENRFAKAEKGDVFYLNVLDFAVLRKAGVRRFDPTTRIEMLRAGFMGVLHATVEDVVGQKAVAIKVHRVVPKGFTYCVSENDPQLEVPPMGTYVKGNKVTLKPENLFLIGPLG